MILVSNKPMRPNGRPKRPVVAGIVFGISATMVTFMGGLVLWAPSAAIGSDEERDAPMRHDIYIREEPNGTISFTDNPDRYDYWKKFIGQKSTSGSKFFNFKKNFLLWDYHIRSLGEENQVEPALIKAVVMVESAFNPRALSPKGARGLMQLMPETARLVGCRNMYDPLDNLAGGTRYLKQMLIRFGSRRLALAAYNAGPRAVSKYNGVPPYQETQQYVRRVESFYRQFALNDLSLGKRR